MTFRVHIELGNDAMSSPSDVADALRRIAAVLDEMPELPVSQGWSVRDVNGNSVGSYGFASSELPLTDD